MNLQNGKESRMSAWLVKPVGEICVSKLSDNELYQKCREYGLNAKSWLRKFAGLLPEVVRRGLHRRKGFISIQEFAGKVAGMSEYAVDRIFQLYAKIKDKPCLLKLFESGEVGWSKIEVVAYVATAETDRLWADKIPLLSQAALSELVKNYRSKSPVNGETQSLSLFSQWAASGDTPGSGGMNYSGASQSGEAQFQDLLGPTFEPPVRFSFPASREVEFDLRLAKQKLEKQTKQVLSWNETFQLIIKNSRLEGALSSPSGAVGRAEGLACIGDALEGRECLVRQGSSVKEGIQGELCKKCAKKQGVFKICEDCSKKIA